MTQPDPAAEQATADQDLTKALGEEQLAADERAVVADEAAVSVDEAALADPTPAPSASAAEPVESGAPDSTPDSSAPNDVASSSDSGSGSEVTTTPATVEPTVTYPQGTDAPVVAPDPATNAPEPVTPGGAAGSDAPAPANPFDPSSGVGANAGGAVPGSSTVVAPPSTEGEGTSIPGSSS